MQVGLRYLHSINMLKMKTKPRYQQKSAANGVALHHDPNKSTKCVDVLEIHVVFACIC